MTKKRSHLIGLKGDRKTQPDWSASLDHAIMHLQDAQRMVVFEDQPLRDAIIGALKAVESAKAALNRRRKLVGRR